MSFFPATVTSSKSSRGCKYGPRGDDGYCPKKPKAAKKAAKKKPCKYGPRDADGYCPKKGSTYYSEPAAPATKKAAAKKGGLTKEQRERNQIAIDVGIEAAKVLADKNKREALALAAKTIAKSPVKDLPKLVGKAATVGLISTVALAGIASYWLTTKVINYSREKRRTKNELAGAAADAYYQARKEAVQKQKGKALTPEQLKILSNSFKSTLNDIGVQWPLKQ